jgi:hypothetical protein
MTKAVVHVILFVAGMVGVAFGVHRLDAVWIWSWCRNKLVAYDVDHRDCDTVFVGSSRIDVGVVPELFDARMAALGKPTRSVNLGLSGLLQHDIAGVLDWVLEHRSPQCKRVVVELGPWVLPYPPDQWFADQEVEMHRVSQFARRMGSAIAAQNDLQVRGKRAGFVLAHTLTNGLRVGQGLRLLDDLAACAAGRRVPGSWPLKDRGWRDADIKDNPAHVLKGRAQFQASMNVRFDHLAGRDLDVPALQAGAFCLDEVREQIARCREAGIELIFVVMPSWESSFEARGRVRELAGEVRLLELDDPVGNEALYAVDLWFDFSHFVRRGAELFSSLIADRIVAVEAAPLSASPPPKAVPEPVALTAVWAADGSNHIEVVASGLPSLGVATAHVADRRAETVLPNGLRIGIQFPPLASSPLHRISPREASARVSLPAAPAGEVFLQVAVWRRNELQAISGVVALPQRR